MKETNQNLHSTLSNQLQSEVVGTVSVLRDNVLTVGFAESCTGGLLSSYFTELAGVSDVFMGSVISYDNKVKQKFLNVSAETLKANGAVSSQTAQEMAEGALKALEVSVAVSITGIAGPSGGSPTKPVGTVFIAVAGLKSETQTFEHHFNGDRKSVQLQSGIEAVKHLNKFINKK
ncbi:CinA family protein [bacterium]|nr:CinA family protein [bacterium]